MGWLKIRARDLKTTKPCESKENNSKPSFEHVENTTCHLECIPRFPFVSIDTQKSELPFINAHEVRKRTSAENGGLLIVVEDIVYDCTDFIYEHPGGEQVIKSFSGQNCTWQFWRFHGEKELEEYGMAFRVGRTEGLKNRFQEPKKYIGLRRLGDDAWD
ncbi:fatty acid desaturas-like protein [Halenospora varia]|nr:fatty acid desaturas-like protein [Halenospora varia]